MAINTMFDRQDDVTATLAQLSEIAASDNNVFARSQAVIVKATELAAQIEALRDAATAASEHRAKRDLAKDLGSSPTVVFTTQRTNDDGTVEDDEDDGSTASRVA